MHTYTAILFSFLLLLGSATSSKALVTDNEIQSTVTFFSGNVETRKRGDEPKKGGNIRAFVDRMCNSGPDLDNSSYCPHRGSGR